MSSRIDPAGGRTQFSRRTALTAAGTVASRLTGFARLVAIAYALGFERLTDTYQLANTTPNIVYELVLGGVLSATFVPVFVARLASADDDDTWRGISAIASAVAAVLVVLAAVVAVAAPWIVRVYTLGNHSASIDDQRAVATVLLRLFAPQVLFYGAVTIITALLNARRRFAAPMFAPVLNNAVVIATVLAFPHVARQVSLAGLRHDTSALLLLGGGTTVGVLAMALAQLPALRGAQVRLRWVWDPTHEAVRAVVRLSGWVFGFVAANQVALWVALALANAHPGGVSAYQAGLVFFVLPHAVVTVSVVTVLQPELAESWATGDLRR